MKKSISFDEQPIMYINNYIKKHGNTPWGEVVDSLIVPILNERNSRKKKRSK